MLGVSTIERLEKLARKGDLRRIDLSVRDIAGGSIGDLPPGTTAANFGKISADATPEDKALAIMNMITESIGVLALASARACGQENIVLTGKLSRLFRFMQEMKRLRFPFGRALSDPRARRLRDRDRRRAPRSPAEVAITPGNLAPSLEGRGAGTVDERRSASAPRTSLSCARRYIFGAVGYKIRGSLARRFARTSHRCHQSCSKDCACSILTDEKGALCGKMFADLGAEVIKVEPPDGCSTRRIPPYLEDKAGPDHCLYSIAYHAGKRSVTLNLDTADGRALVADLVARSDFLVESYPLGYLDSIGLGYDALAKKNPRLIYASITPFGDTGPGKDYKAGPTSSRGRPAA